MSFVPSHIALVAYHGTPGRALADRECMQQIRETILYQLVYYVSTIIVDGWEDEHSAKAKRIERVSQNVDSEIARTAVRGIEYR